MYRASDFEDAVDKADRLVNLFGPGHTRCVSAPCTALRGLPAPRALSRLAGMQCAAHHAIASVRPAVLDTTALPPPHSASPRPTQPCPPAAPCPCPCRSVLYTNPRNRKHIDYFARVVKTVRMLVSCLCMVVGCVRMLVGCVHAGGAADGGLCVVVVASWWWWRYTHAPPHTSRSSATPQTVGRSTHQPPRAPSATSTTSSWTPPSPWAAAPGAPPPSPPVSAGRLASRGSTRSSLPSAAAVQGSTLLLLTCWLVAQTVLYVIVQLLLAIACCACFACPCRRRPPAPAQHQERHRAAREHDVVPRPSQGAPPSPGWVAAAATPSATRASGSSGRSDAACAPRCCGPRPCLSLLWEIPPLCVALLQPLNFPFCGNLPPCVSVRRCTSRADPWAPACWTSRASSAPSSSPVRLDISSHAWPGGLHPAAPSPACGAPAPHVLPVLTLQLQLLSRAGLLPPGSAPRRRPPTAPL